jgi:hypothetical protein
LILVARLESIAGRVVVDLLQATAEVVIGQVHVHPVGDRVAETAQALIGKGGRRGIDVHRRAVGGGQSETRSDGGSVVADLGQVGHANAAADEGRQAIMGKQIHDQIGHARDRVNTAVGMRAGTGDGAGRGVKCGRAASAADQRLASRVAGEALQSARPIADLAFKAQIG